MNFSTPTAAFVATATPSTAGVVLAFARRELRDATSSRWFALHTIAFAALAVGVSFMSLSGTGSYGLAGYARTAAGLLNLITLVVPLMAITAGTGAIAAERERGSLLYLLAQPVARSEVLLGKYVGLALALGASIAIGFGLSGAVLSLQGGGPGLGSFVVLVGATYALALAMLAVGLVISVLSRTTGVASGVGLFVWLLLVLLSDLGLMAGTVVFELRVQEVFALSVANPLQAFKMTVISQLNDSLDVLGPAGVYASLHYGASLTWILAGVLVAWLVAPLSAALVLFARRSPV